MVYISFNQLGGLCNLCFLEEADNLINQNHLFKRSIILIKAWCFYESRILGVHYGLISTYALEILVLYIFHVYDNRFVGPLEVVSFTIYKPTLHTKILGSFVYNESCHCTYTGTLSFSRAV